jgi:hypothetical protein
VAGQFHPEFRSRPTRPHPLFRDFVGAATALADSRDRSTAAPAPAPGVRADGVPADNVPAHNGGDPAPTPAAATLVTSTAGAPEPHPPAAGAPEREGSRQPGGARTAVHSPPPAAPGEPPATVELRGDGLADRVRHDDDPPVPAGPVGAGDPGR